MNRRRNNYMHVVIVTVIIGLTAWLIIEIVRGGRGGGLESAPSTTTSTTIQGSGAVSSTVNATTLAQRQSELRERSMEFVQAYFLRLPRDTAESFTERLSPYASEDYLDTLELDVFEKEPFLSLREAGASIEARFQPDDIAITLDQQLADVAWTEVRLDLVRVDLNGQADSLRKNLLFVVQWQLDDDAWRVYPAVPQ